MGMPVLTDNTGRNFEVGKLVAETEKYRLYICRPQGEPVDHLLKVAREVGDNGLIDRASYILGKLASESEKTEEEYKSVKQNPNHFLNYDLSFPAVVSTFILTDQGNRRVCVYRFKGVDDVTKLVPLSFIPGRHRKRVDLRTSVWIMGKLLKTIAFAHNARIAVNNISLGNVLIEPDQHYVIIFNWGNSQLQNENLSRSQVREEVRKAAGCVLEILGYVPGVGIPEDGETNSAYAAHLLHLAASGHSNSAQAHKEFYELVDTLWPKGFHKFTVLPLTTGV